MYIYINKYVYNCVKTAITIIGKYVRHSCLKVGNTRLRKYYC